MRRRPSRRRRGFSLLEMLIALAISASLLTATFAALHSTFQHYKSTTESASTHVVSRMVMHRMLAMIRTGADFGPVPSDVFDAGLNPLVSDFIEFVSQRNADGDPTRITRLEFRPGEDEAAGALWYVLFNPGEPDPVEERPLLSGVRVATFTLRFSERTWLLERAEIDLTIEPNDSRDLTVGSNTLPQTIRLVASAAPRQVL